MLIPLPSHAPVRVTSVQLILSAGTNEIRSEPPPGWIEHHRLRRDLASEDYAHNENGSEERKDLEGCGSSTLDLENDSQSSEHLHPTVPANSGSKEYVFAKRKIYNTPFTKYWIIRHGERLPMPPTEVDASECSGPAVFVNVPPEGERQIWLWNADRQMWDAVLIKHVVDMDVKRQLNLNSKHVPVFVVPRADHEKGEVQGSRLVRYLAPES
ncbi:hypothetical protein BDM02DRAFT_3190857 [Thelephora ganbajun]|uniref:Uncharacterized protein n=1 Tax=Thelephora ganbajun TaxID=370292 RepID=A0ACB6Z359_THEGA|nr:hypothetical protein BDM02DRAFT_3190857 [Thelephora ganbajun]